MNRELIKERLHESIEVKQRILGNEAFLDRIWKAAEMVDACFQRGGKVLLCGNGGSASDALHIAGELVGRFQRERRALPAIALNADVACLTSVGNDYGFDRVFERGVEGLMEEGDVLIGISTSGNSENVYRAVRKAAELGGKTVGFLGKGGGKLKEAVDLALVVPCDCTARIQEAHITIGHIICELVER